VLPTNWVSAVAILDIKSRFKQFVDVCKNITMAKLQIRYNIPNKKQGILFLFYNFAI
jgi:hypothetical protein